MKRPFACFVLLLNCIFMMPNFAFAFSPYSTRELEQLEKEFLAQINQSDEILRDPLANQYINELSQKLRQHPSHGPDFFIVKSRDINAFAGPGGHIGVNTQLILATENESELAGVMSHEMAHVRLHHLYRMLEHQKQMQIPMLASVLASIALGVIDPTLSAGALMASLTGYAQSNINFIRSNEKEADRIGIDMLIKSGEDPRGMANFFKKLQQNTRYYYSANIPAILRTHPLDEDRIAEAENRTAQLVSKTYTTSIDYYLFKELIRTSTADNAKQLLDYYQSTCRGNTSTICEYGYGLTLLGLNRYKQAEEKLAPLFQQYPNNLYLTVALAKAEIGAGEFASALEKLQTLNANYPKNYAVMVSYANGLVDANEAEQAASILLKASRLFKNDLHICLALARAEAEAKHKDYAYFTEAQCELLQGRPRNALRQLALAKSLAKKNHLLQQQIDAKTEEIRWLMAP